MSKLCRSGVPAGLHQSRLPSLWRFHAQLPQARAQILGFTHSRPRRRTEATAAWHLPCLSGCLPLTWDLLRCNISMSSTDQLATSAASTSRSTSWSTPHVLRSCRPSRLSRQPRDARMYHASTLVLWRQKNLTALHGCAGCPRAGIQTGIRDLSLRLRGGWYSR